MEKRSGVSSIFSLSVQSERQEKEEDLMARNIKGNKPNFRPDKEIKKVLATVGYKKIS